MRSKSPDWKYGNHGMLWLDEEGNEQGVMVCYNAGWMRPEAAKKMPRHCVSLSLIWGVCRRTQKIKNKNLPSRTASYGSTHCHDHVSRIFDSQSQPEYFFCLSLCFEMPAHVQCALHFVFCDVYLHSQWNQISFFLAIKAKSTVYDDATDLNWMHRRSWCSHVRHWIRYGIKVKTLAIFCKQQKKAWKNKRKYFRKISPLWHHKERLDTMCVQTSERMHIEAVSRAKEKIKYGV